MFVGFAVLVGLIVFVGFAVFIGIVVCIGFVIVADCLGTGSVAIADRVRVIVIGVVTVIVRALAASLEQDEGNDHRKYSENASCIDCLKS